MEGLTIESIPAKTSHLAYQVIEGEAVVLDIPGRTLRGFNPVGSFIWQLIDGRRTVREIAQGITEKFEGDPQEIINDVRAFLEELWEKNLITIESHHP